MAKKHLLTYSAKPAVSSTGVADGVNIGILGIWLKAQDAALSKEEKLLTLCLQPELELTNKVCGEPAKPDATRHT